MAVETALLRELAHHNYLNVSTDVKVNLIYRSGLLLFVTFMVKYNKTLWQISIRDRVNHLSFDYKHIDGKENE